MRFANLLILFAVPDAIAAYTAEQITLNQGYFDAHKEEFSGSREKWICVVIWEVFRADLGFRYLDGKRKEVDNTNLKEKFVHGLLETRQGTCCTLPVLYLAVARRLGLPVHPIATPHHLLCRWDDDKGTRFNIEVTNDKGVAFPTDEEMRRFDPFPDEWRPWMLQKKSARRMLGHFVMLRENYYAATRQYKHAVVDAHNALLCDPGNPHTQGRLWIDLTSQETDPVYANSDELRSSFPKKPCWESLPQ